MPDDALQREASAYGVRLSAEQLDQFAQYQDLLTDWSTRMNLVGDASADVVRQRHFIESIAFGAMLRERELLRPDSRILDLGSGAGFPGAVLKIAWPDVKLTLIEATAKKARFLSAVVDTLHLKNATVLAGRAEVLAHDPELRASFDLVVARAVAALPALLELSMPFARLGGHMASPKGSRAKQEVDAAAHALQLLGGRAFVFPFAVPGPPQQIVVVLKQRDTPVEYPREPGVPAKSPL